MKGRFTMITAFHSSRVSNALIIVLLVVPLVSCGTSQEPVVAPSAPPAVIAPPGAPAPAPTPTVMEIASDADLFALVTKTEPFSAYRLFPNADEIASGTLNGSSAHRPLVRTSLNATALGALQNGRLPNGTAFPNGSIVFKEVRTDGGTTVTYAIMYKSPANRLAGGGWLWAELSPTGTVGYSVSNRGGGCTGCHSLERGVQNDLVRTFERQR